MVAAVGGHVAVVGQLLHAGAHVDSTPSRIFPAPGDSGSGPQHCSGETSDVEQDLQQSSSSSLGQRGSNPETAGAVDVSSEGALANPSDNAVPGQTLLTDYNASACAGAMDGQWPAHPEAAVDTDEVSDGASVVSEEERTSETDDDTECLAALDGCTALHLAAFSGHTAVIQALVGAGARIDAMNDNGETALHYAIRGQHSAAIQQLLNLGADPDRQPVFGYTPLFLAARAGKTALVQQLMKGGASVEAAGINGNTALVLAVACGHEDVARCLLDAGACTRAANFDNYKLQPLTWAAVKGNAAFVRLLLAAGADPDDHNRDGDTALHHAAILGQVAVVQQLLEAKAAVTAVDDDGLTPLQMVMEGKVHMPLLRGHVAPEFDGKPSTYTALIRMLLPAGTAINQYGGAEVGSFFLHQATLHGWPGVVRLLVQAGADVDAADPYNGGMTPLMRAADMGWLATVRALLRSKASVFALDYEGQTALEWAVGHGKLGVVRLLLDARAPANTRGMDGMTPLILAAREGHTAILVRLLQAHAEVDAMDIQGSTALDWAVEEGHTQAVELLLLAGAHVEGGAGLHVAGSDDGPSVNNPSSLNDDNTYDGATQLQAAAQSGHVEIVRVLVYAGADVNAKAACTNRSALASAAHEGQLDVLKVLLLADTLTVDTMLDALSAAVAADHEQAVAKILAVLHEKDPEAAAGAVTALAGDDLNSGLLLSIATHVEV